jgi:Zn-dependent protease with chaperone function
LRDIFPGIRKQRDWKKLHLNSAKLEAYVETLLRTVGCPRSDVYISDDADTSYCMGGLWRSFIVLEAYLTENKEVELLSALAHELGHWKYSHANKSVWLDLVIPLFIFSFSVYVLMFCRLTSDLRPSHQAFVLRYCLRIWEITVCLSHLRHI